MRIYMKPSVSKEKARAVSQRAKREGFDVLFKNGDGRIIIAVLGTTAKFMISAFEQMEGVLKVEGADIVLGEDFGDFKETL